MLKYIIKNVIFFAILFCCTLQNSFAGEWIDDGGWWQYKDDEGDFCYSEFKTIDGKTYYFDENSHMATGLTQTDKGYYFFNDDGTVRTEPIVLYQQVFGIDYPKVHDVTINGKVGGIKESDYNYYKENVNEFGGTEMRKKAVEAAKKMLETFPWSRSELYMLLRSEKNKTMSSQYEKDIAEARIAYGISSVELVPGLPTEKFPVFEAMYGVNNCGANWKEIAEKQANIFYQKGKTVDEIRNILGKGFLSKEVDPILNIYANTIGDKAGQMAIFDNQSVSEQVITQNNIQETTQNIVQETTKGAAYVPSGVAPSIVPIENTGVIVAGKNDLAEYTAEQKEAINIANEILKDIPCSKKQLVLMLEAKGLSHQRALDGAEFCGANWHTQAERQAKIWVDEGYNINQISGLLDAAGFMERQVENGATYALRYKEQKVKEQIKALLASGYDKNAIIDTLRGTTEFSDQAIEELINKVKTNKELPFIE